ncbi:MAG TPA: DUF1616 domain-containing protein [Solirubrobacterales bacterium]|nr:DUF1616 domain-containing protein [Solirubrobacterales bacterium]
MRGHRDLTRVSLAVVLCALVAALVPWELVRVIAALPLALFLPGYAIVAAAFGSRELALPKRLMLSVAVSLMTLALTALVLNVFPFGLTTASWAVALPVIVIAACRGAALRRDRPSTESRSSKPPWASWRPSPRDSVLVGAAVVIAIAALVIAQKPLSADNAEGFAALWMLPTNSREDAVRVGVLSSEQDPAAYTLQVRTGAKGRPQSYRVALDPGEEKTFEVQVPPASGGRAHVVASLYRSEEPQRLYRRVTSWLPRQTTFPQAP